jgi:peptidoglycan/LPS O-acetylase OafA/YrhL
MPTLSHSAHSPLPTSEAFTHRPALDGLRTVAVYLVVLFHSELTWMRGGFIGVDLFFVLSGFLVTNVMLAEHRTTGSIQLRRFYARRVRRLLPAALIAIVLICLLASVTEPRLVAMSFVNDARSSLLYVANWNFLGASTNYFADDVNKSPFLHFWSLAIEEQFYFAFPLLLVVLTKFAKPLKKFKNLIFGIGALFVVSLALQIFTQQNNPMRAYYATDTRVYQLAAGALLAVFLLRRNEHLGAPLTKIPFRVALTPLALFAFIALAIGDGWFFSSLSASNRGILATAIAVGLIWLLEPHFPSPLQRVFASKHFTYLGRISYGTYLWHWPLIVLSKPLISLSPVQLALFATIGATALSALSYELIEAPIRVSKPLHRIPRTVVVVGLALSVLTATLLVRPLLDGTPKVRQTASTINTSGLPTKVQAILSAAPPQTFDMKSAMPAAELIQPCTASEPDKCTLYVDTSKDSTSQHIVLMGDSNAEMMIPTFVKLAREKHFTFSALTRSGCPWQPGLIWAARDETLITRCKKSRAEWYDTLLPALKPDIIIVTNVSRDPGSRPDAFYVPETPTQDDLSTVVAQRTSAALNSLSKLAARIAILEPLPFASFDPAQCLSGATAISSCAYEANTTPFPTELIYRSEAKNRENVFSVDYDTFACPYLPICVPFLDQQYVFRNQFHLSELWIAAHQEKLWNILMSSGKWSQYSPARANTIK